MNIYWHVSDSYQISAGAQRATMYGVGGIPHVEFDGVQTVIGAGSGARDVYEPIIGQRLHDTTPVIIEAQGFIDENGGWVTATFRAEGLVDLGNLTAQFVVVEEIHVDDYPWSAREVAPSATVTLSAPGDTFEVTRNFNVTWGPIGELKVVVFLEGSSPFYQIVNAALMPDPFVLELATSVYASEIGFGETALYSTTITNAGTVEDVVTVELSQTLPPGVNPGDWESSLREVGGDWGAGPLELTMAVGAEVDVEVRLVDNVGSASGMATTTVAASSTGDADVEAEISFSTFVELPSILIVDDDNGETFETHLATAVEANGYAAAVWDKDAFGRPSLAQLSSFWAVLWTTANGNAIYVTGEDESEMMGYLDGGGNLFFASQDYLSTRGVANTFTTDYLHVDSWVNDTGGFFMTGVPGDEISDGMALALLGGLFPTGDIDGVTPAAPAEAIFTAADGPRALKVEENGHKIVFTAFPFELVKIATADPSNQKTLIGRVLTWFGASTGIDHGSDGEFRRLALKQNAPNPFNPKTTIEFSVPAGAERVSLEVYNVNGQLVRTLVDGPLEAGPHSAVWDGRDEAGTSLGSGIYFARLSADEETAFRKMTLLK